MTTPNNDLTIDERLRFLLTSTESLHASCQELHAAASEQRRLFEERAQRSEEQSQKQSQRLHQLHAAMLAAIRAFLESPEAE